MPKRFETHDPEIYLYPSGVYYLRLGQKEYSLKTKDFGQACKNKHKVKLKHDQTGEGAGRLKVGDVWDDYVLFRKAQTDLRAYDDSPETGQARRKRKTISLTTFQEIPKAWRCWLRGYWENIRLDRITDDEQLWLDFVDQCHLIDMAGPKKVFRGFLKWCKSKRYIKFIPDLPIPSVERRERRVLKPDEIKKMFQHAEGSVLIFISAYLFMGMRRKEIMTLRWDCIFLDEGYLRIRKSEVKTRMGRPLPINGFVRELLINRKREQLDKGLKTDFVFPNAKDPGRHADLSGLKTAFNTITEKCGWERGYITPHDLRATYEAYAHKAKDFTDTQREKFAGAAIDVQKKIYVRFDADDIRGLESVVKVDGLDSILSKKISENNTDMGKTWGKVKNENVH